MPSFRFEGIRLLQLQSFGLFVIFCQVVFILFVIYFTGRELLLLYRQRCKYFQNYWSYAEMAIIVACYLGIIIYVLRSVLPLHSASVHAATPVECSEYQMRNSRVTDKQSKCKLIHTKLSFPNNVNINHYAFTTVDAM